MDLKSVIRVIPDFPKPGISFKDITTLFKNQEAFRWTIKQLAEKCRHLNADLVACPEARGFALGAALAYELGTGVVLIRKPGKLPGEVLQSRYALEYGEDALEVHKDSINEEQRVLLVDDLLATGGTVAAAENLVRQLGGIVVGAAFIVELTDLNGRDKLGSYDIISLIKYDI
ncbi:adenine phosphoribosyltransferase [Desulfohalotomaculum tongense]|uniref:adenine phosphoribosyltransferase n=1 Tax=Desulforadius tongensis TaxID=1216062 RepID=UPI0019563318|nr:adenine phosphoribosyltransferase [Desulforadius tongensis]MBM7855003.1 adenine phosphoribosyltransferase [Desulforadius tongensis]